MSITTARQMARQAAEARRAAKHRSVSAQAAPDRLITEALPAEPASTLLLPRLFQPVEAGLFAAPLFVAPVVA
jgi:hypothetical protein